jgi:hypothetical protein
MYDTSHTSGSRSIQWHEEEDHSRPRPPNNFIGQVASRYTHLLPIVQGDDPDLTGCLVAAQVSHY